MSIWKQLEQDLSLWLKAQSEDKLIFRNAHQAIKGFPPDGFRSDGMLTDGRILVAIEVEVGQMHPDTNVGKYWMLQQIYCQYERIILFHIYTPDFNSYGWRLELGKFYAKKMQEMIPLTYIFLDYRKASVEQYHAKRDEIQCSLAETLIHAFKPSIPMPTISKFPVR